MGIMFLFEVILPKLKQWYSCDLRALEMIFMCLYVWVLVLVDVFDEWVHDFYNDGYLRLVMVNIIFIDYLELVKDLNYLSWRKLWFWCHGSLDDVI